jgi:pilus assembly protein CpaB
MDTLRDEALRNVMSRVEDRNFGGLRNRIDWRRRFNIKPSRLALLAVALLAGGLAAYLATQHEQPAPPPPAAPAAAAVAAPVVQEKVVQEARTQILVAKTAIGVGERIGPASVEWADWPQGAVRADYVTQAQTPDALASMTGAIVRLEIFPGEPIREEKLSRAADGYLSAVLTPGMRGVSVAVAAEAASGGFIVPNDHVDVVFARTSAVSQIPETILSNVKVLAIGTRLGETGKTGAPTDGGDIPAKGGDIPAKGAATADDPKGQVFTSAIATLEVDPTQAEVLANAMTQGKLTLVLRPIADSAEVDKQALSPANQAIRMTSPFWTK